MQLWRRPSLEGVLSMRCRVAGFDLCVQGECLENADDGSQFCLCEEGYGPDLLTFHMYNCAMRQYTFETFFALFTVLWAGSLITLVRKMRAAHSEEELLVRIGRKTLMFHLTLGEILLGYLLQGGMFELAAAGTFVFFTLLGAIIADMLALVLNMSHERNAVQSFQRELASVVFYSVFWNLVMGMLNVVMIRTQHADLCVIMAQFFFCGAIIRLTLFARKYSNEFVSTLDVGIRFSDQRATARLQRLRARVTLIQQYLATHILTSMALMTMPMFVRLLLGSIPLYYVALFPAIMGGNLMTLAVAELFEGKAVDIKVAKHTHYIQFEEDGGGGGGGDSSSFSTTTNNNNNNFSLQTTEECTNDTCHSGFIVGTYKVNLAKQSPTKKRRRRKHQPKTG